ncbi:MAG: hypothetical protein A2Y24_08650 [Clostridiales bacterium GWE2_32_10]|nr:MAG: hypothetical protein A2Y24_08650 [Clostridiales bacterium GWE2_32_10]
MKKTERAPRNKNAPKILDLTDPKVLIDMIENNMQRLYGYETLECNIDKNIIHMLKSFEDYMSIMWNEDNKTIYLAEPKFNAYSLLDVYNNTNVRNYMTNIFDIIPYTGSGIYDFAKIRIPLDVLCDSYEKVDFYLEAPIYTPKMIDDYRKGKLANGERQKIAELCNVKGIEGVNIQGNTGLGL